MQKTCIVISSMFILLWSSACDNENAPDCFKKTGDIMEKEILLDEFEAIEVMDEVDIYLHNSDDQRVVLSAGKNLIQEIDFEVTNKVLRISNHNKCNWRRTSSNPGIYVYSDAIEKISIFDYSNFFTTDTLTLPRLELYSDGTGDFEMMINIDTLYVESTYVSNFQISGRTDYLNIYFTYDSKFQGQFLESNYCEVMHEGSNRMDVFPVMSLTGQLQSTGDLYYYNDPPVLEITANGTGQLINLSD